MLIDQVIPQRGSLASPFLPCHALDCPLIAAATQQAAHTSAMSCSTRSHTVPIVSCHACPFQEELHWSVSTVLVDMATYHSMLLCSQTKDNNYAALKLYASLLILCQYAKVLQLRHNACLLLISYVYMLMTKLSNLLLNVILMQLFPGKGLHAAWNIGYLHYTCCAGTHAIDRQHIFLSKQTIDG